jgi:hypothetical protein
MALNMTVEGTVEASIATDNHMQQQVEVITQLQLH